MISEFDAQDDGSYRDGSSTGRSNSQSEEQEQLAAKETKAVFRLRVLVFAALFLATSVVSIAVFLITREAEQENFKTSFEGSSAKLVNSFEEIVQQKIGALNSLSVAFTSHARDRNDSWPFVTINDFQQRAASARSLSDSLFLELLPVITDDDRSAWEEYSVEHKAWLDEGRAFQTELGYDTLWGNNQRRHLVNGNVTDGSFLGDNVVEFVAGDGQGDSYIADQIWRFDGSFKPVRDPGPGPYYPIWQSSPILASPRDLVNWNLLDYPGYAPYTLHCHETGDVTIGGIDTDVPGDVTSEVLATSFFAFILSYSAGESVPYQGDPFSSVYIPVYDSYSEGRKTVGVMVAVMRWATYFEGVLTPETEDVIVVLENTIEGAFTYRVTPNEAIYLGQGDLHNTKYDSMGRAASFTNLEMEVGTVVFKLNQSLNQYTIHVYPTESFEDAHVTRLPMIVTLAVGVVFIFTAVLFLLYDRIVERRQQLVLSSAERSNAIVTSLFPSQVRDRLMEGMKEQGKSKLTGTTTKLRSFLDGVAEDQDNDKGADEFMYKTRPIADFFAETTVMFADIVGFTAWSSTREPSQVFTLLETIYKGFDEIAQRRKVFKVETVGDCYVAVCGLPDARKDHALVMARFANDCLKRLKVLTGKLEKLLGPDTSDLQMRVGLHSGPVTAGVLRGERSRFQLFGDTMNTAARVESTGTPSKIHISQETADLIKVAGKENWLEARPDFVEAKGKGVLTTYYLRISASNLDAQSDSGASEDVSIGATSDKPACKVGENDVISNDKHKRLVDWNTDVLKGLLKEIIAHRRTIGTVERNYMVPVKDFHTAGHTVIDEVCEVIELPHLNASISSTTQDANSIELGDRVEKQLECFVGAVCAMYSDNPFHNFEHASHVTMSILKLLRRIVAPSGLDFTDAQTAQCQLHDHTYGITSDPLTQFACVLSGLIHDADHQGVSNSQLVQENHPLAQAYTNKSVAEQNSIDLAWELLMDDAFGDLRACIYTTESERDCFRQLVVNSVMATDIMDKDLKALRNARWAKAFANEGTLARKEESRKQSVDRKATIVIEHLIQASDVAHTMQHWHVYCKWNERLFMEMYKAFRQGRSAQNPADFWAQGEIGFFDFYIIPLARKLKDCGVFGVASDEYLNYATQNRREWEIKGEQIVAEMMEKVHQMAW